MLVYSELPPAVILIVDDMPDTIRVLREAVKDLGDVFYATSGEAALDMVRAQRPDVILLDIEMPGMNGYEVCQAIKADPLLCDIAIIFVTAHDQEIHELQALQYGGVDFIHKPLNMPVARARVQVQLALQRKTRQLSLARRDLANLMHTLPAFVAYWNNELTNVYCNDVNGDWFDITAAEMAGKSLQDVLGLNSAAVLTPYLTQVLSGADSSFEMAFEAPQKTIFGQVSLVRRIEVDDEGCEHTGFLMLITDIGDRKRAELKLQDEKERMRVALNTIGDAVIATDPEGKVTFVNPIAEALTGYQAQEALGKPIESIMPLRDGSTGYELQNPIRLALREQRTVGVTFDCALLNRNNQSLAIEDSAAPIRNHKGKITGAIIVFHDVSEARAMLVKMTHLAQHDPLTNLPNRILLRDRTEQAIKKAQRHHTQVAMLLLDIDHFKTINDSYGHLIGDHLLQQIADRLAGVLRSGDTLCRQGGDEFIILLTDFDDSAHIADFASRLQTIFSQHWQVADQSFELSVSMGISIYPDDSQDMDSLYRHADAAMYTAKQQGRNRYQFFSSEIEERLRTQLALEAHLRSALENNVFEVFYQPKVDARTNQIMGAEALVRWRNNNELIFPDAFIPLAEETGLIIPLGKLVLQKACAQAKHWTDQGLQLQVAINVSAVQFNADFVSTVAEALMLTGVNAQQIELEITESLLVNDGNASNIIRELKELGVRIALDDFGTGYSSLSYLKRFPLDVLKIDQSFVRNMLDDEVDISIVKAIVQMATGLKLRLVAEGVETKEHVQVLLSLGCHIMQGYYYSRPVPVTEMTALLHAGLHIIEH
ncbi:two-component system response regulator [Cellvibrio sp. OA-2007]|uniref:two-component system response regulator n=1 Tax=Cellvibrio sp. OA-2007 TaxID=529823 RepID=UPI000784A912|nr:EAL domain-containing protein [Cellvibrio sp. OA-2007]